MTALDMHKPEKIGTKTVAVCRCSDEQVLNKKLISTHGMMAAATDNTFIRRIYHGRLDVRGVVVTDTDECIALQESYFGIAAADSTVRLSMIESAFLSEMHCLIVQQSAQTICQACLWQLASACAPDRFVYAFAAYRQLRHSGWTIRSGIKFGADFLLYNPLSTHGTHAEFAVTVMSERPQHQLQLNDLTVSAAQTHMHIESECVN